MTIAHAELKAENARLRARCAFAVERWASAVAHNRVGTTVGDHIIGRAEAVADAEAHVRAVLADWDREHSYDDDRIETLTVPELRPGRSEVEAEAETGRELCDRVPDVPLQGGE